jgi:hypothetical protein
MVGPIRPLSGHPPQKHRVTGPTRSGKLTGGSRYCDQSWSGVRRSSHVLLGECVRHGPLVLLPAFFPDEIHTRFSRLAPTPFARLIWQRHLSRELAMLVVPLTIYLSAAMSSWSEYRFRYILPAYPNCWCRLEPCCSIETARRSRGVLLRVSRHHGAQGAQIGVYSIQ